MKYIIVGLGNFGTSLAEKLTETGNEIMCVDSNMSKVEAIKDKVTHAVNLDATDVNAVSNLPLKDTDVVIVAIGEDPGANIMVTALMKQMHVKRLISRAVNPLQVMVLEAMGVEEIIHPEEETAERWSKKLNLRDIVESFEISPDFSIVETEVPKKFDGKTLQELDITKTYNLLVLTSIKRSQEKNVLGAEKEVINVQGVASAKTVLHEGELMVVYGHNKNIKKLLKENKSEEW